MTRTPRKATAPVVLDGPYTSEAVKRAGRRGDALILVVAIVVTAAWFLAPLVMKAAHWMFGGTT